MAFKSEAFCQSYQDDCVKIVQAIASAPSEEHLAKELMEEKPKGEIWKSIKQMQETRNNAVNSVCTHPELIMSLNQYPSYKASYQERVANDFLFSFIQSDKLLSKNEMKN